MLDDAHPGSWKSRQSNVSCMTMVIFRDVTILFYSILQGPDDAASVVLLLPLCPRKHRVDACV